MNKMVIDEAFLGELEQLGTLLKNNVAGMFGGNRRSKNLGSSCEFADYRDYMPGDDVTKIDWNAYARFDKLYQKLYFDERQMHTRIYIDASRSMSHGSDEKAAAAKEFVKFVCDDAAQGPKSVYATGFFPVRSSFGDVYAGTEKAENADFAVFMPYLGDYYNVTGGWATQRTEWWNLLQRVFAGGDIATEVGVYTTNANASIK